MKGFSRNGHEILDEPNSKTISFLSQGKGTAPQEPKNHFGACAGLDKFGNQRSTERNLDHLVMQDIAPRENQRWRVGVDHHEAVQFMGFHGKVVSGGLDMNRLD
jgi:hypothetical protein